MSLLEELLSAQGGGLQQNLGRQFGLSSSQTEAAVAQLLPALLGGLRNNTQSDGGMDDLIGALTGGNHSRYVDDGELFGQPDMINEGNGILGHIFGSKDVSRQVADRASQNTGIGSDVLKKMLPIVASVVMGMLAKNAGGGGQSGGLGGGLLEGMLGGGRGGSSGGGMADILGSLLDADGDGSAMDDIIGMAGKMLTR